MGTPRNQSVKKAFALLHAFHGPDEWVTNAELSRRTNLSEAAAHRLMRTLEEMGVVLRNPRGCYRPGVVLACLSKNVAIGDLVNVTSQDILDELAHRLRVIVHIGVLENGMVAYRAKIGDPASVPVGSRVGAQLEAYCSAIGKVLLAALPEERLEDYLYDGRFVALTPQTITDADRLRSEIAMVRERGYAVDNREVFPDICCVGVPIRDPNGNTIAAISVADKAVHMGYLRQDEMYDALSTAAVMIRHRIFPSYRPHHV